MKKILPNTKGFTLVELLVVVAIIAILAVIGLVIFTGTQKTARDGRRKGDIDAIAQAMEVSYGKTTPGQYDPLVTTMFSSGAIPQDPINTSAVTTDSACPTVCRYCFRQGSSAQTATACANVTSPITTSAGPTGGASNLYWSVCANLEGGGSYCRSNQQ